MEMKKILLLFIVCCFAITVNAGNSKIQFINNSADSSFISAQVKIGESVMVQSLGFRKATAFLDFPYDSILDITFTPQFNAANYTTTLDDFDFQPDSTYICFLNGVGDISKYDANPEGLPIGLKIQISTIPSPTTVNEDSIGLFVMHGTTDMPSVDMQNSGSGFILKNLAYNSLSNRIDREATIGNINVLSAGGSLLLSTFNTKFDTIGGQNVVIFFSGFLSTTANQDGANFSAFAAFQDGKVFELRNVTLVKNLQSIVSEIKLFPNPVKNTLNIGFQVQKGTILSMEIMDIGGRVIDSKPFTFIPSGKFRDSFDFNNLPSGLYFLKISDNIGGISTSKFMISE